MAYNSVFRLLFGYRRSCRASEMFVTNDIYNFEGRMRKHINDFTMRIGSSSNINRRPRNSFFLVVANFCYQVENQVAKLILW